MPTLDFKWKAFVYSHHLTVPFRELLIDEKKSLPNHGTASLDDNLIIHGDNLHALKALLPRYAGKVKCIYIDPPYNTGNEGWCYNDNVRGPLIQEWLKRSGNPVDREDLERHDKWLCMMWPRLQLLRELLADDGAIFISIDDNEVHRLRELMDEVFGEDNFVDAVIWQKNYAPKNTTQHFSSDHDYVLVYARNKEVWRPFLLERTADQDADYKNPDNDPRGRWKAGNPSARNFYSKGTYSIKCPGGRVIEGPPRGQYWRMSEETLWQWHREGRVWWGENGNNAPAPKIYLSEVMQGRVPQTLWMFREVGHTDEAKKELKQIVDFDTSDDVFITPKPVRLIHRILEIATDKDSLVLDSFAGSGTTAHAVLALNKKDGGNRKFILVECEDYADKLTAERVRRVIEGYKFEGTQREELLREPLTWSWLQRADALMHKVETMVGFDVSRFDKITKSVENGALIVTGEKKVTEKVEGLGGSFTYCTLGEELNVEGLLRSEKLPAFDAMARYVFYTATGQTLTEVPKPGSDFLIGETDLYRVHLIYKPDRSFLRSNESALNSEKVEQIKASNGNGKQGLVFATAKFMSQRELSQEHLEFCQLPYAVYKVLGD